MVSTAIGIPEGEDLMLSVYLHRAKHQPDGRIVLTFTLRRLQALQPCLDFRWGRRMGISWTPTKVRATHYPNDRQP